MIIDNSNNKILKKGGKRLEKFISDIFDIWMNFHQESFYDASATLVCRI